MTANGIAIDNMVEIQGLLTQWQTFLQGDLAFTGTVNVQTTGTLIMGDGSTVTGSFTGALESDKDNPG
jgi:hypothetical protein